jgi:protein gp37
MAENSKISWTTHTFNPWIGCTKVAPGCANCYAEADMDKRRGRVKWGPNGTRSRTTDNYWRKPIKWQKEAVRAVSAWETFVAQGHSRESLIEQGFTPPSRPRVFCASLADVFEDWQGEIQGGGKDDGILAIDDNRSRLLTMDDMRADLFRLIDATPNLDWLLVTKRPENIRRMWPENRHTFTANDSQRYTYRSNVWLLTSVSDQATADAMIPELLKARDLVPVLGVSAEPLLGPIDASRWTTKPAEWLATCKEQGADYIDAKSAGRGHPEICGDMADKWLDSYLSEKNKMLDLWITGGESGPHARPHNIAWSRSIGEQCQAAGVAWWHKQHGAVPFEGDGLPVIVNGAGEIASKGDRLDGTNARLLMLKDRSGSDPAEWGEGWLQEMPNTTSR